MERLTTYKFIERAKLIHDNKYDYSCSDYINNRSKTKIICLEHGIFEQKAENHLNGYGCPKCNGGKRVNSTKKFIDLAKLKHGNKYDYSLVNYIKCNFKIKIICPKHGVFEQTPNGHLNGDGCILCYNENRVNSIDDFIIKANNIHHFKYNYSLVDYLNIRDKIKIICPEHGIFEQTPNSHLNSRGCPKCMESKGELFITNWLNQNNIDFETQKTFPKCKNQRKLRYDFYLPNQNLLIEYDGQQHYMPINYFGGKYIFEYLKENDKIKTEYALNNNIKLLRIPDTERKNLSNILKNNIIIT
jgi:very-short-patch-repair endonuclease